MFHHKSAMDQIEKTSDKDLLLTNLTRQTFCRLAASPKGGVGVFAIVDIPAKTNPFQCASNKEDQYVDLTEEEVATLPPAIQSYIKDFFVKSDKGYPVHLSGLNDLNISFYVNHSLSPNLKIDLISQNSNDLLSTFVSNRKISAGEELTCNYNTFVSTKNLRDQFPFLSH
jgi:SET domain-containing protein